MRLKAVYFKDASPTGLPYRKAMVYEQDVPWFLAKGAVEEQPTEKDLEDLVNKVRKATKPIETRKSR